MRPGDFGEKSPGRCVLTETGYHAYIPSPLPPEIGVDLDLMRLHSAADRALGELAGVARLIRDPGLLIGAFATREAVESSRIENTQAGLDDLFIYQANPEVQRTPDVVEVANYMNAMEVGLALLEELPLSGRLVRKIHLRLMQGVRGDQATPGQYRRSQNWIGPAGCKLVDATYVPPPVEEMKEAFAAWERYSNANSKEPLLIKCAMLHYQFEAIHPFIDGNGRVGRLLITLFLVAEGYLDKPLLYLSAFFERHRQEYYDRLLAVSRDGNWRGWLEFFLRGIEEQAGEAARLVKELLNLRQKYRQLLANQKGKMSKAAPMLIDRVLDNPYLSVPVLAGKLGMPYQTLQKGVERLVAMGVLEETTGQKRNRIYAAPEVFELIGKGATGGAG